MHRVQAGYNGEVWETFDAYETDRMREPFVGNAWFGKGLDVFEAQLYIFDREHARNFHA